MDQSALAGRRVTETLTTSLWSGQGRLVVWLTRKWWLIPLVIFLVTRVVEGILLMTEARHQMPEPADYPRPVPIVTDPPTYQHVIANWDGEQYRSIAENGYPASLPLDHGHVVQNTWAFYPLYPALVRVVMFTHLSFGWSASLVSLVCGAAAMCLLYRMLETTAGSFSAIVTVLALCTFAAAVTFQAAYTESLALLLIVSALWCLRERRYGDLFLVGLALSLTRPIVLPLALVVALHGAARWRSRDTDPFSRAELARVMGVAFGISASFLIWPAITGLVTGEPDAYFVTQRAWVLDHSGGWPSWIPTMVHGGRVGQVNMTGLALFAGVVWIVVLARPAARLWGPELKTWAFAYPLYLLAATRPTTSIFRYAMLACVLWWPFPEIGANHPTRGRRITVYLAVASFGLATQVVWLRWFFVLSPAASSYP